jgi:hypothetical protein
MSCRLRKAFRLRPRSRNYGGQVVAAKRKASLNLAARARQSVATAACSSLCLRAMEQTDEQELVPTEIT